MCDPLLVPLKQEFTVQSLDYRCVALGTLAPLQVRTKVWGNGALTVSSVPVIQGEPYVIRKGNLDPFAYGPSRAFLEARAQVKPRVSDLLAQ